MVLVSKSETVLPSRPIPFPNSNAFQAYPKILKVGGAIALEPAKSWVGVGGAKRRSMCLYLEIFQPPQFELACFQSLNFPAKTRD